MHVRTMIEVVDSRKYIIKVYKKPQFQNTCQSNLIVFINKGLNSLTRERKAPVMIGLC